MMSHNTAGLDLSCNEISDAACATIADAMRTNRWSQLRSLVVDGSLMKPAISDAGAVALTSALHQSSAITTLSMRQNQLGVAASHGVAALITTSATLLILDLYCNKLKDEGGAAISAAMATASCSVTELDLSNNSFTERGGVLVADGLAKNLTLTRIGLGWNYLGQSFGVAVQRLLVRCSFFSDKENFRTRSVTCLGAGIHTSAGVEAFPTYDHLIPFRSGVPLSYYSYYLTLQLMSQRCRMCIQNYNRLMCNGTISADKGCTVVKWLRV
jgi:hypothetical protein